MGEIKFLGTGGARFVVAKQLRYSAGTYINCCGKCMILDPGPGTLVRLAGSKPRIDVESIDGIVLTHIHLDHSNDVNILIDSITSGGFKKKGVLFAPFEAVHGNNRVVLPYLLPFLEKVEILENRKEFSIGSFSFESFLHKHSVETYGIKMNLDGKIVSFIIDTQFFDGLYEFYKGSEILILNVVLLEPKDNVMHLSLGDAKNIISVIKPERAVITHFGMSMLRAKPYLLARELSFELGVDVVAASDGMSLSI
jgi:phosphoribosyl 1,2-cyclic phosphodiesterase